LAERQGFPWSKASAMPDVVVSAGFLPRITVVTPSLNQGQYIEETIRSVLLQGYPNLQYIVIDGGSQDQTATILRHYQSFLDYCVSEPDKGHSDALNKGLAHMNGDIFVWINSDDWIAPNSLWHVARAFQQEGIHAAAGRTLAFGINQTSFYIEPTTAKTAGWARINQPATYFSAQAIERMGPLSLSLFFAMDFEWLLRFLFIYPESAIQAENALWAGFRLHPASKTSQYYAIEQSDRFSIYHSIAQQIDARTEAETIQAIATYPLLENYQFPFPAGFDPVFALQSLHYFLWFFGMECYEKLDMERARIAIDAVNPQLMRPEDLKRFNQYAWRVKYLHPSVVQLARKWTR
jgi:glycosyltransferase involved in cell wall biosynthesis